MRLTTPLAALLFLTCLSAAPATAPSTADPAYHVVPGFPKLPDGTFLRSFGKGLFKSAHGLRVDRDDNVWTPDNAAGPGGSIRPAL